MTEIKDIKSSLLNNLIIFDNSLDTNGFVTLFRPYQ